jgi:hypothetical protein
MILTIRSQQAHLILEMWNGSNKVFPSHPLRAFFFATMLCNARREVTFVLFLDRQKSHVLSRQAELWTDDLMSFLQSVSGIATSIDSELLSDAAGMVVGSLANKRLSGTIVY